MKRIICKDYAELSRVGAFVFAEQIWRKPDSVLGFATGGTPVGLYDALTALYQDGMLDFSRVTTFNLDEYYPMDPSHQQSYHAFMWEKLFSHINIDKTRVHLPDGTALDPRTACDAYESSLASSGGIDLQLLGIGHNGHIAFNEPGDALSARTNVVTLTERTVDANARFFGSRDEVPRQALSMGIGSILSAHRLLMLISGKDKAPAVKQLFSGAVATRFPASLLLSHPNVLILLDEDAASLL